MFVLLTTVAHATFGSQLERNGIDWLLLEADGSVRDVHGSVIAPEDLRPEVAWGTSDLFREGAPLRAFFTLMLKSPTLRWFQSPAAGYDDAVFSSLVANGVHVSNAHVNSLPIAEFVLRAVLEEFQEAWKWREQARTKGWAIHDWREVSGTTWVIVGLGGIGTEVARRAGAFGALVIGCRRRPSSEDPTGRTVTPDQLGEVLGLADVVVLAAPATPETANLVDAGFLARMKPGGLLVNVARGSLVDEESLLSALDSGHLGAAILDVFRDEPLPPDHPFWSHPSVRVTPHNAAGGVGRLERQAELFSENLYRYVAGDALLHDVTDLIAKTQ
ncbi:MAG TPA: D-2-hydroxyacid dehydrogenase [Acidimicrobiales bacterium]|nr:D-2-hydroxyacid dehydrogenase [Acidimicrobiales bacterium]